MTEITEPEFPKPDESTVTPRREPRPGSDPAAVAYAQKELLSLVCRSIARAWIATRALPPESKVGAVNRPRCRKNRIPGHKGRKNSGPAA